jgi:hypothetical protein
VLTSPPYALHFKKEYGNADQNDYVAWFLPFAREIKRVLKPDGSFVLNIGGSWTPGEPVRSLYHFRLLLALCDELSFNLCQEFFWYNPAKMPAPAEWVNVRRLRVKDSVEYIFWLAPSAFPKADNSKVLQAYSKDMERLIKRGVKKTKRPSGHQQPLYQRIKTPWAKGSPGPVPRRVAPIFRSVPDRTGRISAGPFCRVQHDRRDCGEAWPQLDRNRKGSALCKGFATPIQRTARSWCKRQWRKAFVLINRESRLGAPLLSPPHARPTRSAVGRASNP